jgi:hypothetical protein
MACEWAKAKYNITDPQDFKVFRYKVFLGAFVLALVALCFFPSGYADNSLGPSHGAAWFYLVSGREGYIPIHRKSWRDGWFDLAQRGRVQFNHKPCESPTERQASPPDGFPSAFNRGSPPCPTLY